jgi:acyl dehydratase
MTGRYLEDYAFAAEFDPQPFHLDEVLASDAIFRGLAASG